MNQQVRIVSAPECYAADGFTAHDFLLMLKRGAFENMRTELVEGVIEKKAPAHGDHGQRNGNIVVKIGMALGADTPIATDLVIQIDEQTVRAVDIAVGKANFPSGPANAENLLFVVEVADSSLNRDLGEKADEYARIGIPTYWVVDMRGRATHVMTQPGETGYASREIVRFGETLLIPGTDSSIIID
jgi:Uma2 family endonuclease